MLTQGEPEHPARGGDQRGHRYRPIASFVFRVARPGSKLSTIGWWNDTTLGPDPGVAGASTDEVYEAMDWLLARQDDIEAELALRLPKTPSALLRVASAVMVLEDTSLSCATSRPSAAS